MKIIISNIIQVEEPTDLIKNYCKTKLTIKNPEYSKKVQMGFWVANTPKTIKLYDYDGKNIYLPIGCFDDLFAMYPDISLYTDYSVSKPRKIQSSIILRDYQKPCLEALKTYVNGLFILPCGLGKTECALEVANYLQQHTLFITHTKDLMNQAKERCEDKMTCSTSTISEGKVDTSGDITFATVQTLFRYLDDIPQDEFGLVVVDECFPKGTKISTPEGYKNIEDIKIGDEVYTYNHNLNKIEIETVNYLFNKDVDDVMEITSSKGTQLTCTCNHPIYTDKGYVRADELMEGDTLYEMYDMWGTTTREQLSKRQLDKKSKNIQFTRLYTMFKKMFSSVVLTKDEKLQRKSQKRNSRKNDHGQPYEERGDEIKSFSIVKDDWSQTNSSRWKWSWFNNTSKNVIRSIRVCWNRRNARVRRKNQDEKGFRVPNVLQIGYWCRRFKNRYRNRWSFPFKFRKTKTGPEKGFVFGAFRVENIKIQKRRRVGESTNNNGRIKVYNIGVSNNHNYFANGILVHNCHHLSANADSVGMFRECLDHFAARYKLGLTATLHRADGLEYCIPKLLGNPVYEIIQDKNDYVGIYENNEVIRFPMNEFQVPVNINIIETGYSLYDTSTNSYRENVFKDDGMTIVFSKLITDISEDKKRNSMIIDLCNSLNGSTIVLSDRVEQLKYLNDHIKNSVEIDGSTSKNVREKAIEDVKNGKYKVLLASYKLAKEGLDCKILENVVFATPIKDEAIVIQCIGRAQRTYPGKTIANVYDLKDNVSMLDKFLTKRRAVYKKKGWWKK